MSGDILESLCTLVNALKIKLSNGAVSIESSSAKSDDSEVIAKSLSSEGDTLILLGHEALNHPQSSTIRYLASLIAKATNSKFGFVTEGANTMGACLTGITPHREINGTPRSNSGLNTDKIKECNSKLTLLWNSEPNADVPNFADKKENGASVIAFSTHFTDNFSNIADLMLPIGTFAETSGTFINCEGSWQSFNGVSSPVHEARPGWKVLTVIGDLLKLDGFEFESSLDVLSELREKLGKTETSNNPEKYKNQSNGNKKASVERVPMYQMDAILRHSPSLQLTPEAQRDSKT